MNIRAMGGAAAAIFAAGVAVGGLARAPAISRAERQAIGLDAVVKQQKSDLDQARARSDSLDRALQPTKDSLSAVVTVLARERASHAAEVHTVEARADSARQTVPDTASYVARPIYDAVATALDTVTADRDNVAAQLRAQTDLLTIANASLAAKTVQAEKCDTALTMSMAASDAWRKAARGTIGTKLVKALKVAVPVTALTWLVTKDKAKTGEVGALTLAVSFAVGG